ncbi:MAG TPA: hypothetical protein VMW87_01605 [Spirochaetia bacterium]|nr:hypothetical protein [Spirochaetia bacterium]
MTAPKPIDYTTAARWRSEIGPVFMPEPEQAGESEAANVVDENSGPPQRHPIDSKPAERRRSSRTYQKIRPPSHMGQHVDIYA